jgi:uncharacterized protein YecE (DUF72 family)
MDHLVDFYLFQLPPKFDNVSRILRFAEAAKLGERFALEIRNEKLLGNDVCTEFMKKVTLVSVDSPDYRNLKFSGKLYIYGCMGEKNGTCIIIFGNVANLL